MTFSCGKEDDKDISFSLDELSKKWNIDPIIRDLHLGRRTDVIDHVIKVNQVTFHIPFLSDLSLFLLWGCLWPECHNCCNKQGRLPLTSTDIPKISKRLKYPMQSSFLNKETYVASWDTGGSGFTSNDSEIITTLTMINLKRKSSEEEGDNGKPIPCRFLDGSGACTIHPEKPGVCWLYPFFSWSQNENNHVSVHASYQLTGDCPGFYLSNTLNDMSERLDEYSKKIYSYAMEINTSLREGYARIDMA